MVALLGVTETYNFDLSGNGKQGIVFVDVISLCDNLRGLFWRNFIPTFVLLCLKYFEEKTLPKSKVNCKIISKLLSAIINSNLFCQMGMVLLPKTKSLMMHASFRV